MEQSNIIKNAFIEISRDQKSELWSDPEYQFSTLTLEIEDVPPTSEEQRIAFSIDMSGSMSDVCPEGRSKMQHIIHTTKNIVHVFSSEKNANITVEIYGFDDKLEIIVPSTKCEEETCQLIQAAISSKLRPRESTDISIALKNAAQSLQAAQELRKTHIFMTDGQITTGEKNIEVLTSLVDSSYPNVFVGFGSDHDAYLLQSLAENGSYYYIDHIETAGLAYGEITHAILYQALEDVEISIENGEIYDYLTNTWSNTLKIRSLVGEAKKTYHLKSKSPSLLLATITAKNAQTKQHILEEVDILPELLGAEPNDFTKYLYRQRTLELLYEAREKQKIEQKMTRTKNQTPIKISFSDILTKLSDFLKNMMDYMQSKNLTDDDFMKNLCDDISVCISSLKLPVGIAYSAGRARSNGSQGCYQPTFRRMNARNFPDFDFDLNTPPPPALNRANTSGRQMRMMQDVSEKDESQKEESQKEESLPPPRLMRATTGSHF
jgi:thymidylate kinase